MPAGYVRLDSIRDTQFPSKEGVHKNKQTNTQTNQQTKKKKKKIEFPSKEGVHKYKQTKVSTKSSQSKILLFCITIHGTLIIYLTVVL